VIAIQRCGHPSSTIRPAAIKSSDAYAEKHYHFRGGDGITRGWNRAERHLAIISASCESQIRKTAGEDADGLMVKVGRQMKRG
jgi:hypothetical protein